MKGAEPSSILIIRLSSMGDVILTTHLVRNLRNNYPDARIDFITTEQFSEIYKYNPHISNLYEFDKSWNSDETKKFKNSIIERNINKKYDLLIDLQRNLRSFKLCYGLGRKIVKVRKNRLNKLSLVYFKKSITDNFKQIPEIYFDTISGYKIEDDGKGLELWLSEENEKGEYLPILKNKNNGYKIRIAIAPGAYHFTKRWIPESFARLIKKLKAELNCEIIIIGGKSDTGINQKIIEMSKCEVIDKSGSESIINTAEIISQCNLLITNDTGVMHIAAARQVPVIAIFGSTVKEFGFTPFRVKSLVVEKNVPCRPCSHIGRDSCPKGHFDCMNKIKVEDVFNTVELLLRK